MKAPDKGRSSSPNEAVQPTGASRLAQWQIERHGRLAPAADLCRSASSDTTRMRYIIAVCAAALAAFFAVSCSTVSRNQSPRERNLGVVELSPHIPKRVSLGHGQDCVVTLRVLPDGNLQWEAFIETKTTDGKLERSCASRMTQRPDQRDCGVTVGDTLIILTPKVRQQ
jgi:hypothetical protein